MLWLILLAGVFQATHSPAAPTVGDRIAVHFGIAADESVLLDPSPDYEVISRSRDGAIVRTFKPQPLVLSGRVTGTHGTVVFRRMILPVRSVFRKGDDGKPAPLTPPVGPLPTATPGIALALAAAVALTAWAVLYRMTRRQEAMAVLSPPSPDEELRAAIEAIRRAPGLRWGALADATRRYLSRVAAGSLGSDLTTRELLGRLASVGASAEWQALVRRIVMEGDLDKFSPWGASAEIEPILHETIGLLPQPFRAPAQDVAA